MGAKTWRVLAAGAVLMSAIATATSGAATAAPSPPETVFGLNVLSWEDLRRAETKLGQTTGIVGVYRDFVYQPNFPLLEAQAAAARGSVLLIAWEPWAAERGTSVQPDMAPDRVLAGDFDPLIESWAASTASFGSTVMIRFAPEMNGNWRPWSPGVAGGTSQDYVDMWRYVVDRFEAAGATNVRWVWNPFVETAEATPMAELYPGDAYVDYVALDGFNWGKSGWGWQSYDDIFASSVDRLDDIAPEKPWMIAEVGCAPGGKKADWTKALLTRARSDGASAVVWFEINKEADWRITSDRKATRVVSDLMSKSGWLTGAQPQRVW